MKSAEFRENFKAFLDDDNRYRRFLTLINHGKEKRLLFWQEQVLEKFCKASLIDVPNFEYIQTIFAICEVHYVPLERGKVKVFRGHVDYSDEYNRVSIESFPNSHLSEINGPAELYGKFIDVLFCPSCRDAEKSWEQENA